MLFLHGAAFSARTWQLVGSLDVLAASGLSIRAIAVDLPGFGDFKSGTRKDDAEQRDTLVYRLLRALGWKRRVLVVAASMGGGYGAPFVLKNPTQAAGYVPVAALGLRASAPPSSVPTLVLWGELDTPNSPRAQAYSRVFSRSQKIVFADAPHPCYLKAPARFNRLLLAFAGAAPHVEADAAPEDALRIAAEWQASAEGEL